MTSRPLAALSLLLASALVAGCMGGDDGNAGNTGGNGGANNNTGNNGGSGGANGGGNATAQNFTDADNGKNVTVAKGATFNVTLESNPSTGHSWSVKDLDATKLRLVQDGQHQAGACPQGAVGCGGTTTFRFEALAAGTTTLKLDYTGPAGIVAESYRLNVTITA